MNAQKAEKILSWLFRLNAFLLTLAFLTMLMPNEWMNWCHEKLGLGSQAIFRVAGQQAGQVNPIAEYLARSCSMLYGIHGLVLLIVAFNLRKYWQVVPLLIGLHVALGAMVLLIDLKVGMPWYWAAAEGPGIMAFAAILFWLYKKADTQSLAAD